LLPGLVEAVGTELSELPTKFQAQRAAQRHISGMMVEVAQRNILEQECKLFVDIGSALLVSLLIRASGTLGTGLVVALIADDTGISASQKHDGILSKTGSVSMKRHFLCWQIRFLPPAEKSRRFLPIGALRRRRRRIAFQ